VIGIDSSAAVLEVAQEVISAPNVRFVHARAEIAHEVLEQESIDLVLCNSAFWKCEPRTTLHAINTILKPDGKFLFNVVENYTRQQAQWQLPTAFQQVLLAVARERGIPAPERKVSRLLVGEQSIEHLIRTTSLVVEDKEEVKMQRTAEEVVEFFKIPAMAELYFPDVTYEQVEPLFPLASQRFHHERVYSETWTYYALQKCPQ
jgi:ubiquinone/menaquinone biosynthesis C-methylase UbiE